jgi:aldehyde dehydrogenase (NAD+)
MKDYPDHYFDGRWTPSESTDRIEVVNPFNEQVIATVPAGTAKGRRVGGPRGVHRC